MRTRRTTGGRAQGYNFIFRSLSALFCGLFTPPSVHAWSFERFRGEAYSTGVLAITGVATPETTE